MTDFQKHKPSVKTEVHSRSGEGKSGRVEEESRTAEQSKGEKSRQQDVLSSFDTAAAKSSLRGYLPAIKNCIVVNKLLLISQ